MAISRAAAICTCCALAVFSLGSAPSEPAPSVDHAKPAKRPVTVKSGLLRSLTLRERIAQMIIVRAYGDYPRTDNAEYTTLRRWIAQDRVGGFIVANRVRDGVVINARPFEMAAFVNHLQRLAKTPLLVASDFEHGASMRVSDTAKFPYLMAFGAAHDETAIRELGAATAQEARALGVQWVFAPDADVNNNPDNPIINVRSFGEDPQAVAADVASFIEGAHSDPQHYVLVSAKHFPGHGDTAEDSHMQLAKLDEPKDRVESVELVPFRAAIAHGVDSIMTAHMTVPAFEEQPIPATVSHNVLTGLLRDELGFKGIIVTDGMDMAGLAALYSPGEAAVRAVEAGADVLLMPSDPEVCIRALVNAVAHGRISPARIDASALKVMAAKLKLGLFKTKLVNLDELSDELKQPRLDQIARTVAEHAVTLVKDDKHLFPIPSGDGSCLAILAEGAFSQRGQALAEELQRGAPGIKVYATNSGMPDEVLAAIAESAAQCKQLYVATFVTVAAYRGSVGLQGGLNNFLNALVRGPAPVALISLGNPYLLRDYPGVAAYAATFSTTTTSEVAAAKAILGEIPIDGKMPVSIPGLAKIGDGLTVPVKQSVPTATGTGR
ncbi:MAG: glycoside hydrolase family 3 N-terminal domain-containing protein [Bryobacteraceae bacterium]